MSQEYTEDKEVTLKSLSGGRRVAEALLLLIGVAAIYLLAALISFDPADPSWSQTAWHEPINNYAGSAGAWIADTLLFTFGVLAYSIPPIFLLLGWMILRPGNQEQRADFLMLALRIIGALVLLISSCGLAAFNIDDIYYFASGGVIGSLLNSALQPWFNSLSATLLLLCNWAVGLTLFTGWSWLTIAEKIGAAVLDTLAFLTNRSRPAAEAWSAQTDEASLPPLTLAPPATDAADNDDPLFSTVPITVNQPENDACQQQILPSLKEVVDDALPVDNRTQQASLEREIVFNINAAEVAITDELPEAALVQQEIIMPMAEKRVDEESVDEGQFELQQQLKQEFIRQQQARYGLTVTFDNEIAPPPARQQPVQNSAGQPVKKTPTDSLLHPFLSRNDKPLPTPTTPLPALDLLMPPTESEQPVDRQELERIARLIEARLADYRVKAHVVAISPGPVVTRFELDLAPGVKAARISNLDRDLARSLSAVAVRIVEVIPGKPYVGLELPNKYRQTVYLREVLDCPKFHEMRSPLAVVLGKDISGYPVVADLAKMPHLLVAGTTGSGKSVGVNAMIISILYKAKPDEVKFIMIDPKMLELSVYEGIPHLLTEVVTDMKDAANALRWCVNEMERRYKLMSALGVRNISGYNDRVQEAEKMERPIPDPFWKPSDGMGSEHPMLERLPYIVVMVDEFADLIMAVGKKVEELIARLAQKARAAGIHLVLATQRPSVDVITGLIKANVPTRIAFTVSSKIDSRTILDQSGAESLLGMGDMLYLPPNSSLPVRVHGAFVRDEEVHAVVQDWKARGKPNYIENILSSDEEGENGFAADGGEQLDPLFDQAVEFVIDKRRASISGVQRQFRIGYNRAARIIEQMELQGIVTPPGHNGNREVLARSGE